MNGYLKNFELQIKTLKKLYKEFLKPIENKVILDDWWVFGGGTALSIFHFNHRKSYDIDIFITQAQVFDFLNPKWYIDDIELFDEKSYRFNASAYHLSIKTNDDIKVDFLLNEAVLNTPIKNDILDLDFDLYYESIEDIIAKKVKYRKEDNLARDIFDLAVAIENDGDILQKILDFRFIGAKDLQKLNIALNTLDHEQYKMQIEKIKPQNSEFLNIALKSKEIIQTNIKKIGIIS